MNLLFFTSMFTICCSEEEICKIKYLEVCYSIFTIYRFLITEETKWSYFHSLLYASVGISILACLELEPHNIFCALKPATQPNYYFLEQFTPSQS